MENDPHRPFDDLDARLKKARKAQPGAPGNGPVLKNEMSGVGQAFRIGAELISSLIVGTGIGWFLDNWLGTKPWFMIIFIFLGGAAGIMNVYRTGMRMVDDVEKELAEDRQKGADEAAKADLAAKESEK